MDLTKEAYNNVKENILHCMNVRIRENKKNEFLIIDMETEHLLLTYCEKDVYNIQENTFAGLRIAVIRGWKNENKKILEIR